jgi:hypothetical protein
MESGRITCSIPVFRSRASEIRVVVVFPYRRYRGVWAVSEGFRRGERLKELNFGHQESPMHMIVFGSRRVLMGRRRCLPNSSTETEHLYTEDDI